MRKTAVAASLFVVLVAVSASAPPESMAAVYAYEMAPMSEGCTLFCINELSPCVPNEHDAYHSSEWPDNGGGAPHNDYNCYTGTCAGMHPCAGFSALALDLDKVRGYLAKGEVEATANLIAAHSEFLTVNLVRSAVQVRNCNGDYIGHFPLSSKLAAAVAAHVAALPSTSTESK